MAEKVSEISLTTQLESDYILHQDNTIKNYFYLIGFVSQLTSIINISILMGIKSRQLYNVLYHICDGKFRTEIFFTDYVDPYIFDEKDHVLVKLFCTDPNNSMNLYHPCLH